MCNVYRYWSKENSEEVYRNDKSKTNYKLDEKRKLKINEEWEKVIFVKRFFDDSQFK